MYLVTADTPHGPTTVYTGTDWHAARQALAAVGAEGVRWMYCDGELLDFRLGCRAAR